MVWFEMQTQEPMQVQKINFEKHYFIKNQVHVCSSIISWMDGLMNE